MVVIRPVDELKRAIKNEIREELTSGDVSVNELTNAILKVIRDRLPASLTASGNLKTAILEDMIGIAKDSTLATIGDRLPSSLTTAGNFKVAILEDGVGLAKDSTLSSILSRLDTNISTRASETTLSGIKSQTDKLTFDASNRLVVNANVVANPSNLDVALSTRASESTLVAVRDRLPSSLTAEGNFKVAVTEDLIGLAKSSDLKNLANLDLALSYMWKLLRWGRNVNPFWVHGSEVTAPPAGTSLASVTVSSNMNGYIYGFYISAGESNDFKINWISGGISYSVRIVFPSKGSVSYIDITPINEGLPADPGTTVTITNVNAGSSGVVYQARIFYAESPATVSMIA